MPIKLGNIFDIFNMLPRETLTGGNIFETKLKKILYIYNIFQLLTLATWNNTARTKVDIRITGM